MFSSDKHFVTRVKSCRLEDACDEMNIWELYFAIIIIIIIIIIVISFFIC